MGMTQQQLDLEGAGPGPVHESVAQVSDATPGIEHHEVAVAIGDGNAGSVAAVASCAWTGGRDGTADAPERHFRSGHQCIRHAGWSMILSNTNGARMATAALTTTG